MLQPSMFATGTIDHFVYLWKVQEGFSTSMQHLAIKHTALIQSLLPIQDSSHKLLSAGADCTVNIYDLSSERVSPLFLLYYEDFSS
jgi:WD40 repeat protein